LLVLSIAEWERIKCPIAETTKTILMKKMKIIK
jgi:hypothetical protein